MASPSSFPFTCPGCKTTFAIPVSLAGQAATCETCHTDFQIPALHAAGPAPQALPRKSAFPGFVKNTLLLMIGAGTVWVVSPYLKSSKEADPAADPAGTPAAVEPAPIISTTVAKRRPVPPTPPVPPPAPDAMPPAVAPEPPAVVTAPPAPIPTAEAFPENKFIGPIQVPAPEVASTPTPVAAPAPAPPAITPPSPKAATTATPAPVDAAVLRKDPRLTLERFLNATSIEERLTVSQNAAKVRPLMVEHYRTYPPGPQPVEEIIFLTEGEVADTKRNFHLYNVFLKDENAPIPVAVEETNDGYRVDWATYAESYTHRLRAFFAKPSDAPGLFRVVLRRAHYFGPRVPGQDTERIAYTVASPMRDETFHVWADKDSLVYKEKLSTGERAGWDIESYVIAELSWRGDDTRGRWVALRRIPAESWRGE